MPYQIALSSLRPSIALNPKSIAFIYVIFVLIVLFDYIYFFWWGGGEGPFYCRLLPLGPGYTVCLVFLCSFYVFIF